MLLLLGTRHAPIFPLPNPQVHMPVKASRQHYCQYVPVLHATVNVQNASLKATIEIWQAELLSRAAAPLSAYISQQL